MIKRIGRLIDRSRTLHFCMEQGLFGGNQRRLPHIHEPWINLMRRAIWRRFCPLYQLFPCPCILTLDCCQALDKLEASRVSVFRWEAVDINEEVYRSRDNSFHWISLTSVFSEDIEHVWTKVKIQCLSWHVSIWQTEIAGSARDALTRIDDQLRTFHGRARLRAVSGFCLVIKAQTSMHLELV